MSLDLSKQEKRLCSTTNLAHSNARWKSAVTTLWIFTPMAAARGKSLPLLVMFSVASMPATDPSSSDSTHAVAAWLK